MTTTHFLTRRTFSRTFATSAFAVGSGLIMALPSGQMNAAQWNPASGLRLAGPVAGIPVLDPALVRDYQAMTAMRQIFRGLLGFTVELEAVPQLAASVRPNSDATRFDVTLRDDVRFHDGRPIVAADVEATFFRALNPATAGGDASALAALSFLRGIVGAGDVLAGDASALHGIEIRSDRELSIHLSAPDSAFPLKLASVASSIVDTRLLPATLHQNGTGPFRVESFDPEAMLDLQRAESWYGSSTDVESVSFRLGILSNSPLNLYQAGEIDIIDGMPYGAMQLISDPASGSKIGDLFETPLFSVFFLAMSPESPPFDDVHIRKAVQLGFPWRQLATAGGGNVLPAEGFLPPGMLGQQWTATLPRYDLNAARDEIRKSRYGTAEAVPPMTIYSGQTSIADPVHHVGAAIRDTLGRDLGLSVEPISVEWETFLSGLPQRRFPTYCITWIADYPDPESLLGVLYGSESPDGYSGYTNPAFDGLLARASAELDLSTRVDLYMLAQQMLIDDAVVMPFFFDIGYTAVRPGISGVPVSPIGMTGLESVRGES